MGSVFASALEQVFSSRWGGWFAVVLFALMVIGVSWSVHAETMRLREQARISRAQTAKAQALWLSECGKPIDECAAAWDKGNTLRELYRARVPLDRKKSIE